MSTYKEIKGFKVQTLNADPVVAGTSWSSGGNLNMARYTLGNAGTQTAALGFGGYAGPPAGGTTGSTVNTEAYDGTSWTEVNNMNQAKGHGVSFGLQTAAIFAGGYKDLNAPPYGRTVFTETESWNGSSWTEVNNLPKSLYRTAAFGTSTAGITAAGATGHPASDNSESYSWDGTNWTDGPNVNTPRSYQMGLGTSTAGMIVGGYIQSPASVVGNTEIWNGSAWTEVNDLNTARRGSGASTLGSTSEGIIFGGSTPPVTTKTEVYNGTSWSETADLANARMENPGGSGVGSLALAFGGENPSLGELTATEEFSVSTVADTNLDLGQVYYNSTANAFKVTQNVDGTGSWATGGNLNTKRMGAGGAGIQTAGAIFGGDADGGSPRYGLHEQYNGTSWTESTDLNQGKAYTGGAGTQTSALNFTGYAPQRWALTELWNGSSWTELNDMNTARFGAASVGQVSTAALAAGGSSGASATADVVESWNGSSWTEIAEINTGRAYFAGSGTPSAGLVFGGPSSALTELWNGSSWTEVNDMNSNARTGVGGSRQGTSTSALGFGGNPNNVNTEIWNGTSWTEVNNLATARGNITGIGTTSLALAVGGEPPYLTATEEWTQPSSVLNQTITAS